jgi:hypothetical protein
LDQYLVKLHLDQRIVVVGKILHIVHNGVPKPIFYTEVSETDIVRKWDAVSIAPAVLDYLVEHGINWVHFWIRNEQQLLEGTIESVRRHGRCVSLHSGIGVRYHVARRWLDRKERDYEVPWLDSQTAIILRQSEPIRQLPLWEVA